MLVDHLVVSHFACACCVLIEPTQAPAAVIVATGSEVKLARAAAELLAGEGITVRVVSTPCVEMLGSAGQPEHVVPFELDVMASATHRARCIRSCTDRQERFASALPRRRGPA